MTAYYNEIDLYAAQWLRNLIDAGHIAPGVVDTRSIKDVRPEDLVGFKQCHFFAGIGRWALAARIAGWPDDRELWSGSAPCQPFSVAGKGKAQADDRHLWPHLFRLIRARKPDDFVGEQVAAAVGKDWLDGVFADLEGVDYACGAAVVPACAVDAPHRRDRIWIVAHAGSEGLAKRERERGVLRGLGGESQGKDAANDAGSSNVGNAYGSFAGRISGGVPSEEGSTRRRMRGISDRPSHAGTDGSFWDHASQMLGHDGKARRVKPGIRLLAHGVPARVGRLRAYGNAIVPEVAAEVIGALMDCYPGDQRAAA